MPLTLWWITLFADWRIIVGTTASHGAIFTLDCNNRRVILLSSATALLQIRSTELRAMVSQNSLLLVAQVTTEILLSHEIWRLNFES